MIMIQNSIIAVKAAVCIYISKEGQQCIIDAHSWSVTWRINLTATPTKTRGEEEEQEEKERRRPEPDSTRLKFLPQRPRLSMGQDNSLALPPKLRYYPLLTLSSLTYSRAPISNDFVLSHRETVDFFPPP